MKRIILILGIFWGLCSCEREHIQSYHGDNYIQFTKLLTDSSVFSFTFYPQHDTIEYGVVVQLVGDPVNRDRYYKMSVSSDYTTAGSDNYLLPTEFVLKKNQTKDTAYIKLIKTADLQSIAKRLTLRLEESSDFQLGSPVNQGYILWINDMISKPAWWNSVIEKSYLGTYSDKKYRLFIEHAGVGVLSSDNPAECRYYTLIFKNWLREKAAANDTVYEDDEFTEMTVALIGG